MSDYGLWTFVVLNSVIFIAFVFGFFRPRTRRDWRSFGAFSAFLMALFTEMYGFPLTLYLASGWLQSRFPEVDWFAHESGHLFEMLFGWRANPHFGPFHLASMVAIVGGLAVLARAWPVLYRAQREGRVADTGPYARVRHPQYGAFVLILFGFLLQWPTLLTVVMFPMLVWMYGRLALREEAEAEVALGQAYREYARRVPRFFPRFRARRPAPAGPSGEADWIPEGAVTTVPGGVNGASRSLHLGFTHMGRSSVEDEDRPSAGGFVKESGGHEGRASTGSGVRHAVHTPPGDGQVGSERSSGPFLLPRLPGGVRGRPASGSFNSSVLRAGGHDGGCRSRTGRHGPQDRRHLSLLSAGEQRLPRHRTAPAGRPQTGRVSDPGPQRVAGRRLGVQAYGGTHSEAIPRILALLAADPDAAVLRARLEGEIRCAAADILAEGGGWDDVRTEMRQLVQAIAAVFRGAGVDAHEVREAFLSPLETALDETLSTS